MKRKEKINNKFKIKNIVKKKQILKICRKKNFIEIDKNNLFDIINFSLGLYEPLTTFCDKKNFLSITNHFKYKNDTYPVPILLNPINKFIFKKNENYILKFQNRIIGYIELKSIFKINVDKTLKKIYKTTSNNHPGVKILKNKKNIYVHGNFYILNEVIPNNNYFKDTLKIKIKNKKQILKKSVAFSTRNICHFGHKFIQNHLLEKFKKLFIFIIETPKNKYNQNHIFRTYEILKTIDKDKKRYNFYKIFLPLLYAGPREAFFQAIILKNLGIKNFSIGRDHAGIKKFYGKYESQKIFEKFKIKSFKIFKTKEPYLCRICKKIFFENKLKKCSNCNSSNFESINGYDIKKSLKLKKYNHLLRYIDYKIINFFSNKIH